MVNVKAKEPVMKICPVCGKEFNAKEFIGDNGLRRYCSPLCKEKGYFLSIRKWANKNLKRLKAEATDND